jgi:hypothetical protein
VAHKVTTAHAATLPTTMPARTPALMGELLASRGGRATGAGEAGAPTGAAEGTAAAEPEMGMGLPTARACRGRGWGRESAKKRVKESARLLQGPAPAPPIPNFPLLPPTHQGDCHTVDQRRRGPHGFSSEQH